MATLVLMLNLFKKYLENRAKYNCTGRSFQDKQLDIPLYLLAVLVKQVCHSFIKNACCKRLSNLNDKCYL